MLHVGTQEFGMGHATVFAQVAADVLAAGSYLIRGTDRRIGLFEVARAAETRGRPLAAAETFETRAPSYPSGCQLCEVEVDPATGRVRVLRHVMVADPGRVLNPLIVTGQLHGGIAQGIGQALLERVVRDFSGSC